MTEKEARYRLSKMLINGLIDKNFSDGHSGYEMAVKFMVEHGYLDVEYLYECYYNSY